MIRGIQHGTLRVVIVVWALQGCQGGRDATPSQQPPAGDTGGTARGTPAADESKAPKSEVKTAEPAAGDAASEKKGIEAVKPPPSTPPAAAPTAALMDPALAKEKAPETFKAKFATTKGDFVIEVTRAWAPNGADRFYNLVKAGYFNDVAFFRNIKGFMVQFGINGDPAVNTKWIMARIPDDPVTQSNAPGYVTFATSGPNSRTTQLFINHGDNKNLDGMGFSPFGVVVEGIEIVKSLHDGYGEGAPRGRGPNQGLLQEQGNKYLKSAFPLLDYVKTATILP
ncbi:MAG TPA: peptidylprolyl isomerase [Planctomycetota bacterium]|nr:peptidylprolyl isomerase [Planctomycetota bacterium]